MRRGTEHPCEWLMLAMAIGFVGALILGGFNG